MNRRHYHRFTLCLAVLAFVAATLAAPRGTTAVAPRAQTQNSVPVAAADSYSVQTRSAPPLSIFAPGVLANDTDADGDQLTARLISGPSHGTVFFSPDGSFMYAWTTGFSGADTFTYRAGDGKAESDAATVTINVLPNRPPIAIDDFYTTQGQPLDIHPPGVLNNDSDPDRDWPLRVHPTRYPAHGTAYFATYFYTGGFIYTPEPGFVGTDTITYYADDGELWGNDATVTIYVTTSPPPRVQFGSATYEVAEGCVSARLSVTLTRDPPAEGGVAVPVVVNYSVTGGTASQRADYVRAAGSLTFAPGETTKEIALLVNEDGYAEGDETVRVTLTNPLGAALGPNDSATLTIRDDDAADSPTNPADDSRNFVCQNYHDFLGRQPDEAGWQFWTENIERCGADAGCLQVMRVNTSAAFFLSIEYQQTGYFVDRLYEACLGRRPHYEEFMNDTRAVGFGVEVGVGDWQGRLEENKRAYTEAFVRRAEFLTRYPTRMTADAYVNEMFEYAGVEPTAAERQAAVAAFGEGNTAGRAAAMRSAMESAGVFRHYYNRAFVLSEYFGYLRRDPNAAPDSDWTGYDFWLKKMDAFSLPGEDVVRESDAFARVRRAEMVRAFIESAEYRQRFGRQ